MTVLENVALAGGAAGGPLMRVLSWC